ncbi:uroporphyrinogen decarboxylase family protein [Bacillus thermotolerans]|uniref:uroporphyrinogen decarboxylase family protein n=1 Tax=Bacillus thermotolerans TaxID=1221996 RepID=UPI000588F20D|nr:uroporphyrinogen decarboxylase family protein [Bacillus thermotolerans]KKB34384.1 Methylcobalamin:coenzyme M methyltransferase [Bacillus thermotolerans]
MNQKELVQKFFKGRAVTRPPFLPLPGTYLVKVDQVTIPTLLQDDSTLYSSLINTQKLLGYDAIILPIDTSLEAEAFGAKLQWNGTEMPVVAEHLPMEREIDEADFLERGRVPIIKEVVERLVAVQGKELPIIATISGPFTILQQLYGKEIESADTELIKSRLETITQALIGLCKSFGDAKVDGILINEEAEMTSDQMKELSRAYKPIFNVIKFYNIFGIFRLPDEIESAESIGDLSDAILGPMGLVVNSKSVRTKGIALPDSVWEEALEFDELSAMWKDNKKRRLFFSTRSPLNLEISLNDLQEKTAVFCAEEKWA